MFKTFLLIIFTLLSLSSNISAEVIKNIIVEGNQRISVETIKVYGEVELNQDFDEIRINQTLKKLYETDFFEDISIFVEQENLKIVVKEYPLLNFVELEGEKSNTIKKSILERLKLKSNGSYIQNRLNEDINTLKKIYSSIGFNFATIEAKLENFSNNRVNLTYIVKKGNKTNIKKINFTGDKKLKEKRLRDVIVSEEKKFWKFLSKNTFLNSNTTNLDKRLLENYYKSLGYYDVQVLSSNAEVSKDNSTNLTYTINAGKRYKINKISTNISDVLDKSTFLSLEKNYEKIIGRYYSPFKIKNLLDDLDRIINDNDLQFVEHSVNEILEEENIQIQINVYEGKKELVERVNVFGNTVTDESVIRSELLLDEGDPYNKLKLDRSVSKLKSRNIFAEVITKVSDGSSKNLKIIDISIDEKPTGEISAGAGIGTAGGSFGFSISENNWMGKGIGLVAKLDVSSETFSGGLNVINPNYNFSGNSLNYFIENSKNDKPDSGFENSITSMGVGSTFEQYKNIFLSPSITFSYDDLKVDSTASSSLQKQKGTFSDLSFGYGISYDNRDRAYQPTAGYITSFNQSVPLYADSPSIRNTFQTSIYNAFNEDLIGVLKFYASATNGLNNKDVRLSKRTYLSNSRLRGFKAGNLGPKDGADYVGGNYAASTNFEINLPNILPEGTKTDVGLFLDFGNVWGVDYDKSLDDSNKIRSSAGVTTNWLSPVGPMSFIFSQNISKASTDVTESFNFRLGTTF